MDNWGIIAFLVVREAALFAAAGYLLVGLSEFAVDLIWIKVKAARWWSFASPAVASGPKQTTPSTPPLAVFIPAWQEGNIIGHMLRATLRSSHYPDFRLYVGCYPNDAETIAAVRSITDPRVRIVVGSRPGGTTKADCLNTIWRAMCDDEKQEGRRFAAVVLQDAEDVVHGEAFGLMGNHIGRYDMVQLPVIPIIERGSWISGHYADEFAESHHKDMAVRQAVGAALPAAGVGCAFARDRLAMLATGRPEGPFDPDSLTEDYELGLTLGRKGGALFLRVRDTDGRLIGTGEHFPASLPAAVRQKARWITGIALAGWDRLGWRGGVAERWMRLRDRQPLFVMLLIAAGYAAAFSWPLFGFGASEATTLLAPSLFRLLIAANMALLVWRLILRFAFTASIYGWRQGLAAVPRLGVSTLVLMLAGLAAIRLYLRMRRTGKIRWDKTRHRFPAHLITE